MRLNLMLEPQEGLTYGDILAVARRAQANGFEGVYRSDHYKSVQGRDDLASTDAWVTLALARDVDRIMLGTMVSPVTFRPAGNLAMVVATVAQMAPARVHLGLGTGWLEGEHRQFGFPFEDTATRFRRLGEHLQILRNVWAPDVDEFTFEGEFERLVDIRFAPKPDPVPRIIVGGRGAKKTPLLAARYADELNVPFPSPELCRARRRALDSACASVQRDPATVTLSVMTGCVVGATDAEFEARMRRLQQRSGDARPLSEYVDSLAGEWVLGTPEQAVQRLAQFAEAGVDRVLLQHQVYDDLEMLDVLAEEVTPHL